MITSIGPGLNGQVPSGVAGLSPEFLLPVCVVLRPGRIHGAPPDYHVIVEPVVVRLSRDPRESRFRPAIDPLFRSAAQVYGPAAIGVVLSGNVDEWTAGLRAVKELGGIAIVQDPSDALFPSMPRSAPAVCKRRPPEVFRQ
jgi:chemotaxis response regulator CheB